MANLIKLVKGCFMGLAFIMFLPAAGFAVSAWALYKKLTE